MPLADHQFSYNGLTMGAGTNHPLFAIEGLGGPSVRVAELELPEDHGAYVFGAYTGARRVILEGASRTPNGEDLEALVTAIRQAFVPQASPLPLTFLLPGDGDIEKRILAIPSRGPEITLDSLYGTGQRARWIVELIAADPRIYAEVASSLSIQPGTPPGGIDFSVDFDLSFGGGSSVAANASNAGIIAAYPTARVDGPCTNPKIQNDLTGEYVRMNITVAAGDFLDIDFAARTILLNGTASRYSTLDEASTWWAVHPGDQTIQFIVSGANANTELTLTWRSAWI